MVRKGVVALCSHWPVHLHPAVLHMTLGCHPNYFPAARHRGPAQKLAIRA